MVELGQGMRTNLNTSHVKVQPLKLSHSLISL